MTTLINILLFSLVFLRHKPTEKLRLGCDLFIPVRTKLDIRSTNSYNLFKGILVMGAVRMF